MKIGDFVIYDWRYYVVVQVYLSGPPPNGEVVRYILQDLLTGAVKEADKDIQLVFDEKYFIPFEGLKVVYNDTIWTVESVEIPDSLSGAMYQIKRNNASIAVDREDFKIFNPVTDRYLIGLESTNPNAFYPVITTGSFVINPETNNVGVVTSIEEEKDVCIVNDLVNGGYYKTFFSQLQYIAESDIKLVPGIKVIYSGKVGTYCGNNPDFENSEPLVRVKENFYIGLKEFEYEIFNPYFHDYEERNGVKVLKLRNFVGSPENRMKEDYPELYPAEILDCSKSFLVEELKQKDQKVGLKQSEGKLMVQELYWPFIEQMARVMTINKEKYPPKNYLKPMDKEELLAAAQRHTIAIWNGEEIDPTDGQPHSVKVATNMMMYYAQTILYV